MPAAKPSPEESQYDELGILLPAEKRVLALMAENKPLVLDKHSIQEIDMEQAPTWGTPQVIRGSFLSRFLLKTAPQHLDGNGLELVGAKIVGVFDLEHQTIPYPMTLTCCFFEDNIVLTGASLKRFYMHKCFTKSIIATGADIDGSLWLFNGFRCDGMIKLHGAKISGDLLLINATINNPKGKTLFAQGVEVGGRLVARKFFLSTGELNIQGSHFNGGIDFNGGSFINPDGVAIFAEHITCDGACHLGAGFQSTGQVRFLGARIGKSLFCSDAHFGSAKDSLVFVGDSISVNGAAHFQRSTINGQLRLLDGTISGSLECDGTKILNPGSHSFNADRLQVDGALHLRNGFQSVGTSRLLGARIGGYLDCCGATFSCPGGIALGGDNCSIRGNLYLRDGFHASGDVRFPGSHVNGDVDCSKGVFFSPGLSALTLENSHIRDSFNCEGASFSGSLNLNHSTMESLRDTSESWPKKGDLHINGLKYSGFLGLSESVLVADRIAWLSLQPEKPLRLQPHEHLAHIYINDGMEESARLVQINKQHELRKRGSLGFGGIATNYFLEWTVGYGYRPWRVLWWFLGIYLVDVSLFIGLDIKMSPSHGDVSRSFGPWLIQPAYPAYNPWVYTLNILLPILNLWQDDYWIPSSEHGIAWGVVRVTVIAGWTLSSLLAATLTGITRRSID